MPLLQSKLLLEKDVTDRIVHAMQEGLLIFNDQNEIRAVNTAALGILQFPEEAQLLGKQVDGVFFSPEDAGTLLDLLEKDGQINQKEAVFVTATGEKVFCLVSGSLLCDNSRGEYLKVLVFHDITERKLAELEVVRYSEKLEKTIAELDQFAYIVSHDLKAPLRAITSLSEWLYEDIAGTISEENRKSLDLLKNRAFRMEALINGILEYSKIGRVKMELELVDVKALILEIIDLITGASPAKELKISFASTMPVLRTSRILLHQVFANLINNAIKYNDKPEVSIEIGMLDMGHAHQFHVHDNGPGIPEEFHEKVFVIFQTLQSRDTVESTGIGLTIVKRIIEERGGKIWIDPSVSGGTKMLFTWPKNNPDNRGE